MDEHSAMLCHTFVSAGRISTATVQTIQYRDEFGYVEAFRIEVKTLAFAIAGFEVWLRATSAHAVDPAEPVADHDFF